MLLETYDLGVEPRTLHLILGAILGLIFGIAAQITRFCLRRVVSPESADRGQAGAVWLSALAAAVAGFQIAQSLGWIDVSGHRFLAGELPILAIVMGGVAFGAGMILTRGCVSRLTVLGATGNLRALLVLALFAVVVHATMKGVLAPLRTALGSVTVDLPVASLAELPIGGPAAVALALVAAAILAVRVRPGWGNVGLGVVIGLLPVIGWAGTSVLLMDEFDPLPVQSMAFTLPWSDTLFWTIASTAVPAGFGTGLIGGVLLGAFLSGFLRGELRLESFESPRQTLRYAGGAALMGLGGVLAGGCTVGAGLSGAGTLSIAALLALASIVLGGVVTSRALGRRPLGQPA